MPLSHTTAILRIPGVLGVFSVLDVADCVLGTERNVTTATKKGEKTREVVPISLALLEAPAQRFVCFGENDIRPRHLQGADRRPGGVGRGAS